MLKRLGVFLASILLCILLPLLPIAITCFFLDKGFDDRYKDVMVTAALYPISLFIPSRYILLFSIGIFATGVFCALLARPEADPKVYTVALWSIFGVSVIHLLERFEMHVIRNEKLIQFNN